MTFENVLTVLKESGLEIGAIITLLGLAIIYFGKIISSAKLRVSTEKFEEIWGGLFFLFLFIILPIITISIIPNITVSEEKLHWIFLFIYLPVFFVKFIKEREKIQGKEWILIIMVIFNAFHFWIIYQLFFVQGVWFSLSLVQLFFSLTFEAFLFGNLGWEKKMITISLEGNKKEMGELIFSDAKYIELETEDKQIILINRDKIVSINVKRLTKNDKQKTSRQK